MEEKEELVNRIFGERGKIIRPLMGGMMNQSFLVQAAEKKYVLYMATPESNKLVERAFEKKNQANVYALNLTSKNIYFDIEKGNKINRYIEGSSLDKLDGNYSLIQISDILKTLHDKGKKAPNDYNPFKRLEEYEEVAKKYYKHILKANSTYQKLKTFVLLNRLFLESQPKVLCHNDAQKSNIIKDKKDKYYFIDFEFAGNNDPIYDIASFGNESVEEGFALLNAYCLGKPTWEEQRRYYLWRMFISLQWYLVAITKHYQGEGKTHNYNFMEVANHFKENALIANEYLIEI